MDFTGLGSNIKNVPGILTAGFCVVKDNVVGLEKKETI